MFLSIATTYRPATDLGFLLMKHPDRKHDIELSFGAATVFYPEASTARCEAVLTLDIDPLDLVRGRGSGEGILDQYVNDRPYAASSFLSVAINRAFNSALNGRSRERPDLAAQAIPLTLEVAPLPAKGGAALIRSLFEPLGWDVTVDLLAASGRYARVTLSGEQRLSDALSHLYVLIPVLDDDKHYWVGDDEIDKLISRGGAWLAAHPSRELIARRYLKNQRSLARVALARLAPDAAAEELAEPAARGAREDSLERPIRLHDLRLDAVAAALAASGATSVADLGCGEGKLLTRLLKEKQFRRLVGLDASARSLEIAAEKLGLDRPAGHARERVQLLHGALTYRDERWSNVDAAALVEVIEHIDADRLAMVARVVFEATRPKTVVVTTPNAEHNALFPSLAAGAFRHPDHRFEWTREEFRAWAGDIERRHGYAAIFSEIGPADERFGAPTQMAVFTR